MDTPKAATQQSHAKPKSGMIWLASYPKSGNTWTRAYLSNLAAILEGDIEGVDVNSIGRFSVGENFTQFYRNRLGFEPTGSEEHRKLIASLRHAVQQEIVDSFEGLVFAKTHNALVMVADVPMHCRWAGARRSRTRLTRSATSAPWRPL